MASKGSQAQKIRERLGGSISLFDEFPEKHSANDATMQWLGLPRYSRR
jgi:hypothetical protein